jgi:hypothetical protein
MLVTPAAASSLFGWQGNLYKHIRDYDKHHKEFVKKVCTPGIDFKYKKLLKNYRSQGHYLPLLGSDIDRKAISNNLHFFKKKLRHIEKILKKLKKDKKLPSFEKISEDLKKNVEHLLELKKKHLLSNSASEKLQAKKESIKALLKLKKQFATFMNEIYFFKSFRFPNDHLQNRFNYDKDKDKGRLNGRQKANQVFFYRKLVEDGTYEKNKTRGDIYTRTTLDTLHYSIKNEKEFISENVRHDLEWSLKVIERFLRRGYKKQVFRFEEWRKRTIKKYRFYKDIIKSKNKKKAAAIVQNKNKASIALKKFNYKKQAETYLFWKSKPQLWKSLFVLETILYNEVGTVDEPDGLEREDVAHIVMNRVLDPVYSQLRVKQPLVAELKLKKSEWQNEKWLNTLFRVGEFSFTYHYISSSSKIFCPDMSRRGKNLRKRNLKISLKALKNTRSDFNVFRYFSRISMLGKIDMSSVWKNYVAVPEKHGYEASGQKNLLKLYKSHKYEFFYEFTDPNNIKFQVLRINNKIYSMTFKRGRPFFYKYRNPHLFKYFQKK